MKSSVKFSILAVAAVLISFSGYSAFSAPVKMSKGCEQLYQKWKRYGGAKAFFETADGLHCGYSYGIPNISYAITWGMKSCNKYGKGEKCIRVE